jgi:cysteine desulfurase
MSQIYLDYNATAPMRPEVRTLVTEVMATVGNASSVHGLGRQARKYIEDARAQVGLLVKVKPDQVIFTSGATESLNTILSAYRDKKILISAIEHPAVIDSAPNAIKIPVTADGVIDVTSYEKLLKTEQPDLVAIMMVNSETGVIQPIKDLAAKASEAGAFFLCDSVQAAGRLDLDFNDLGVDYMVLSAHKIAGPQGVGVIITRKGLEVPKFMLGGGQEKNCRAGTYNTAGIAGMGLAAKLAQENLTAYGDIQKLRDQMEGHIIKKAEEIFSPRTCAHSVTIYGQKSPRVGNTMNVGIDGMDAQTQLMALDLDGIAVSSGSACSSGSFKPSHVLAAMGADEKAAKSALRISIGYATTQAEIEAFLESYDKILEKLK